MQPSSASNEASGQHVTIEPDQHATIEGLFSSSPCPLLSLLEPITLSCHHLLKDTRLKDLGVDLGADYLPYMIIGCLLDRHRRRRRALHARRRRRALHARRRDRLSRRRRAILNRRRRPDRSRRRRRALRLWRHRGLRPWTPRRGRAWHGACQAWHQAPPCLHVQASSMVRSVRGAKMAKASFGIGHPRSWYYVGGIGGTRSVLWRHDLLCQNASHWVTQQAGRHRRLRLWRQDRRSWYHAGVQFFVVTTLCQRRRQRWLTTSWPLWHRSTTLSACVLERWRSLPSVLERWHRSGCNSKGGVARVGVINQPLLTSSVVIGRQVDPATLRLAANAV